MCLFSCTPTGAEFLPKHEPLRETEVLVDPTPSIDCTTIHDSLACMETEGCYIEVFCTGRQLCDLVDTKEKCDFLFCNWQDDKCLPIGDGTCGGDNGCPIISGCQLRAKCAKE